MFLLCSSGNGNGKIKNEIIVLVNENDEQTKENGRMEWQKMEIRCCESEFRIRAAPPEEQEEKGKAVQKMWRAKINKAFCVHSFNDVYLFAYERGGIVGLGCANYQCPCSKKWRRKGGMKESRRRRDDRTDFFHLDFDFGRYKKQRREWRHFDSDSATLTDGTLCL